MNDWTVQIRWSIFMNRRRRSERRNDKEIFGGASPHIKRSIPFFDILDEDKLEIIEGQVDWLIENIGIAFRDDPVALSIWQRAGGQTLRRVSRSHSR